MKKGASKPLKVEQLAELTALATLPDDAIDTSDAPELLDWSDAKRGLFYRPEKQQLTLRCSGLRSSPNRSPHSVGRRQAPHRACQGRQASRRLEFFAVQEIDRRSPEGEEPIDRRHAHA